MTGARSGVMRATAWRLARPSARQARSQRSLSGITQSPPGRNSDDDGHHPKQCGNGEIWAKNAGEREGADQGWRDRYDRLRREERHKAQRHPEQGMVQNRNEDAALGIVIDPGVQDRERDNPCDHQNQWDVVRSNPEPVSRKMPEEMDQAQYHTGDDRTPPRLQSRQDETVPNSSPKPGTSTWMSNTGRSEASVGTVILDAAPPDSR